MSTMRIGIPVDHRGAIKGAEDMLRECAKHFMVLNQPGHASMAEAHALRLGLIIRALAHGERL